MRIKIESRILEKTKQKSNYTHETMSMILNKLSSEKSKELHKKEKFFRFITFTNLCINKELNTCHFYISGDNSIVEDFITNLSLDNLIRIDDMVLWVTSIIPMKDLSKKDSFVFKTDYIIKTFNKELNKSELCTNVDIVKERLIKNSLDKCKQLGVTGNLDIEFIGQQTKAVKRYKDGHIFSHKGKLKLTGDYDIINTIYNVGIGENTFSGHGFMWEV